MGAHILPRRGTPERAAIAARVRSLVDDGCARRDVAKRLGLSYMTVWRLVEGDVDSRAPSRRERAPVERDPARCPRCLLSLPHDHCVGTIDDFAAMRRQRG